jgi:hypothetical protein
VKYTLLLAAAAKLYFSCKNEMIGVDFDVIAQRFDVKGYWRVWWQNGSIRVKGLGAQSFGL